LITALKNACANLIVLNSVAHGESLGAFHEDKCFDLQKFVLVGA